MADARNAHIRRDSSKRRSKEVETSEAQRLLADPAYIRGFDNVRNELIRQIEFLQHDGSAETDAYERELCRTLRTLRSTQRAMKLGIQGHDLREAGFKPREPEKDDQKEAK